MKAKSAAPSHNTLTTNLNNHATVLCRRDTRSAPGHFRTPMRPSGGSASPQHRTSSAWRGSRIRKVWIYCTRPA